MPYSPTETTLRPGPQRPQSFGTVATLPVIANQGTIAVTENGARTGYRGLEISLSNVIVNITNSAGTGFTTLDLWTFANGSLAFVNGAARVNLTVGAGIPATSSAVIASLGTAATADTTLNGAEANVIASTAVPALVASVGTLTAPYAGSNAAVNGMTTAAVLRLNLAVTTGMTATTTITLSGKISVQFNLLDVAITDPVDY